MVTGLLYFYISIFLVLPQPVYSNTEKDKKHEIDDNLADTKVGQGSRALLLAWHSFMFTMHQIISQFFSLFTHKLTFKVSDTSSTISSTSSGYGSYRTGTQGMCGYLILNT